MTTERQRQVTRIVAKFVIADGEFVRSESDEGGSVSHPDLVRRLEATTGQATAVEDILCGVVLERDGGYSIETNPPDLRGDLTPSIVNALVLPGFPELGAIEPLDEVEWRFE